jgi:hypothetical protein
MGDTNKTSAWSGRAAADHSLTACASSHPLGVSLGSTSSDRNNQFHLRVSVRRRPAPGRALLRSGISQENPSSRSATLWWPCSQQSRTRCRINVVETGLRSGKNTFLKSPLTWPCLRNVTILEFGCLCGARGSVRDTRGSVPCGEIECESMNAELLGAAPERRALL